MFALYNPLLYLTVPDADSLSLMHQRESDLAASHPARHAYSLPCADPRDVTHYIRLRVVRQFGLPDSCADILHSRTLGHSCGHAESPHYHTPRHRGYTPQHPRGACPGPRAPPLRHPPCPSHGLGGLELRGGPSTPVSPVHMGAYSSQVGTASSQGNDQPVVTTCMCGPLVNAIHYETLSDLSIIDLSGNM